MVTIDLNGVSADFYDALDEPKRPFKNLNLMPEKDTLFRYDPFHMVNQADEDSRALLIRELALAIIPLPPNVQEAFWIQSAQNILTGSLIYYQSLGITFIEAMINIQSTSLAVLIRNVSQHPTASMYVNQFSDIKDIGDNKTVMGVKAELSNHVIPFITDAQIVELFTPGTNSIEWNDTETHNIFVSVNESEIEQKSSAIRLILCQLIRHLERRPDKHSPQGKLQSPLLLVCDEFPRYGKLEAIESAIATLRKRNVTIAVYIQGIEQLEKYYGKLGTRIIFNNSAYQVILGVNDLETQQYLAERIGSIIVPQKSYGESYSNHSSDVQGYRTQISETRELIYQPHELGELGNKMILITPHGFCKLKKSPCYLKGEEK
jgi:type IV secretory pathway TraG/TraD family ATPase VirD4